MNKAVAAPLFLFVWLAISVIFLCNPALSGRYLALINLVVYAASLFVLWVDEEKDD
jgi:hypothetical protein